MQEVFSSQYDGQWGAQQYGAQFAGQQMGSGMGFESRHLFQDSAVHTWQTNGRYLQQVMCYCYVEVLCCFIVYFIATDLKII